MEEEEESRETGLADSAGDCGRAGSLVDARDKSTGGVPLPEECCGGDSKALLGLALTCCVWPADRSGVEGVRWSAYCVSLCSGASPMEDRWGEGPSGSPLTMSLPGQSAVRNFELDLPVEYVLGQSEVSV